MTIIDRFEGEYAVCEVSDHQGNATTRNIPKVLLPQGAREGDCLCTGPDSSWLVDQALTAQRRKAIQEKLANLYGGD